MTPSQPGARSSRSSRRKLASGITEVLGRLGAGNEVVIGFQRVVVRKEDWVVNGCAEAVLGHHLREGRSWSGAEV